MSKASEKSRMGAAGWAKMMEKDRQPVRRVQPGQQAGVPVERRCRRARAVPAVEGTDEAASQAATQHVGRLVGVDRQRPGDVRLRLPAVTVQEQQHLDVGSTEEVALDEPADLRSDATVLSAAAKPAVAPEGSPVPEGRWSSSATGRWIGRPSPATTSKRARRPPGRSTRRASR
jgi:hypothetical protein